MGPDHIPSLWSAGPGPAHAPFFPPPSRRVRPCPYSLRCWFGVRAWPLNPTGLRLNCSPLPGQAGTRPYSLPLTVSGHAPSPHKAGLRLGHSPSSLQGWIGANPPQLPPCWIGTGCPPPHFVWPDGALPHLLWTPNSVHQPDTACGGISHCSKAVENRLFYFRNSMCLYN